MDCGLVKMQISPQPWPAAFSACLLAAAPLECQKPLLVLVSRMACFRSGQESLDLLLLPGDAGFGAAYGTAKSGVGIASMGVMRPELVMKSIVPVVMAGVLGIYGLIIAVIISTGSALSATSFLEI